MKSLTPEQAADLQNAYGYLETYDSDGEIVSFDPTTYQAGDGDRLIHIAAYRGDDRSVALLLDAGEDIDARGDMGSTPAHYAAMGQHKSVFAALLRQGADKAVVDEFGRTPEQCWDFWAKQDLQDVPQS
jgi:ankyrin repeat protein